MTGRPSGRCVCAETSIRNCPVHGQGRPSGRCAAQDVLYRFYVEALNGIVCTPPGTEDEEGRENSCDIDAPVGRLYCASCKSLWQDARAALASPCCVSAADQEQVKEALERIAGQQAKTLEMIRRNGFVFETPLVLEERTEAERWEKLAFSIYMNICEVEDEARAALALLGSQNDEEEER